MADGLDILRQDALARRIKGVAGGLHIVWSAKDIARISDHIAAMPEKMLARDLPATPARKLIDTAAVRRKLSEQSIVVRAAQEDDLRFLFIISSEAVDLAGDVITVAGIDCSDYLKNPAVLAGHDSSAMPIAVSTSPLISGKVLTAIAEFPQPGVSECSDQTAAAIRAKLVKGASIGFVPLEWTFTTDASRPFGINFLKTKILEWSICALPCNPDCLMIGAVAGGKAARRSSRRNIPNDDVPDEGDADWQCNADAALAIDSSDDVFDSTAAKAALLEQSSPGGTILPDQAAKYFLASDASAPLAVDSYQFPFAKIGPDGIIASKTGWRAALAEMEQSKISDLPLSDARSLVDGYEARLGDAKMAQRRREAAKIVAAAKVIVASIGDDPPPLTRDQRLAEAGRFKRLAQFE